MLTKPASPLSEKAVTVENRTDFEIDVRRISKLVDFLKGELGISKATSVDVTFVDEDVMTELHVRYMGLPGPTDVLSFPAIEVVNGPVSPLKSRNESILGDIVICPAFIAGNALSEPTQMNIDACVIHSILHLMGFTHDTFFKAQCMTARHSEIIAKVPISFE